MKKTYRIRLTLKTALHINAGVGGDKRRIFVKSGGRAYIPATVIKGVMRNNADMLVKTFYPDEKCIGKENAERSCSCMMCTMFGKAGFSPSRIVIDNLYTDHAAEPERETRTNVAINRYARKAENGALVNQETVSAAAEPVFEGGMTVYYPDDSAQCEKLLLKALEMIDSIGSAKSRGLGLVETEVTESA